jgi:hypothetical protein
MTLKGTQRKATVRWLAMAAVLVALALHAPAAHAQSAWDH